MLKQAHAISEELIEWRRDFHMHPEIGFELHRTSKIVADELEKMGYRVKRGVGKTGVVAEIGDLRVEQSRRVRRPVEDAGAAHEAIDALVRARRVPPS